MSVSSALHVELWNVRAKISSRLFLLSVVAALLHFSTPALAGAFGVTNFVTDDQLANPALLTDTRLVNAWGLAGSSTGSPFWVGDNGTGQSTLYAVSPTTGAVTVNTTTRPTIPGDGTVTGVTWNSVGAGAFNGDAFLFVSEDGTISGWRGGLGPTGPAEVLQGADPSNVYKGTAFASIGGNSYLYAANFRAGTIDVLKGNTGAPDLAGKFVDPNLPAGYAPFNIVQLGGKLYVTYAVQDGAKHDEVAGAGNGIVDVYDLQGNFISRVGAGGTLNAPWGLAIAPTSFGMFGGDLLVGNFGDGTINAFNLGTNAFAGQLHDLQGNVITIDGLWALEFGRGGASGGDPLALFFTAGPNDEGHGLFGVVNSVPEPESIAMFGLGLLALGFFRGWRPTCPSRV